MKPFHIILSLLFVSQLQAQIRDFEHIDFKKADSIALSYNGESIKNLPQLSQKLTTNLSTDVERFRAIYRWVCSNIKNDYSLYLRNKGLRQRFKDDSLKFVTWNNTFRKKLFKKLVKKKRTICTGYAYLVKALAGFANLECEIVQGYGRVSTTDIENLNLPNHSWNAVKLNGKWYLCDPTWASGIPDTETNRFTFQYNDGFFLPSPELFAINHFPFEEKWWLLAEDIPSFDDFLAAPVLYGKAYEKLLEHQYPKQMHHIVKPYENVKFQYQLNAPIEEKAIQFLMDNGISQWRTKPTSVTKTNTSLILEHQFKNTGVYDVHLYLDNDLISTYTIEVVK